MTRFMIGANCEKGPKRKSAHFYEMFSDWCKFSVLKKYLTNKQLYSTEIVNPTRENL